MLRRIITAFLESAECKTFKFELGWRLHISHLLGRCIEINRGSFPLTDEEGWFLTLIE